jgi:uncharacterized membrane protein YfcA
MNAAAVVIFVVRTQVDWRLIVYVAIAAIVGGQVGVLLLRRINETILRVGIVIIGAALTVGLFVKS